MKRIALLIAALSLGTQLTAENLGQHGQTYVLDQDARETIKDALRAKQKTGELDRYWQSYRDKTIAAIKNPEPLGVATSYEKRSELRQLRYQFPSDVRDPNGTLLVKKGTVVEPLKLQPLRSGLIFIDGRDSRQVDFAISLGRRQPMKIVLTAGSPYALRVKYKDALWYGGTKTIPFYFDQRKMIINTMASTYGVNITSVPVILSQQGDSLSIEYGMGDAK